MGAAEPQAPRPGHYVDERKAGDGAGAWTLCGGKGWSRGLDTMQMIGRQGMGQGLHVIRTLYYSLAHFEGAHPETDPAHPSHPNPHKLDQPEQVDSRSESPRNEIQCSMTLRSLGWKTRGVLLPVLYRWEMSS